MFDIRFPLRPTILLQNPASRNPLALELKALYSTRNTRAHFCRVTQEDLAVRLGIKPQQIQGYEASDYQTASFARLLEIARVLNLDIREQAALVLK